MSVEVDLLALLNSYSIYIKTKGLDLSIVYNFATVITSF